LALLIDCLYNAPVMRCRPSIAQQVGLAVVVTVAMLAACSKKETPKPSAPAETASAPVREVNMEIMLHGSRIYLENCAQCHGPEAQGHPDWQNSAVTAAPPLNGTGNEWKRRRSDLVAVIQNGLSRDGKPVMPGWKGRLSDKDIDDLLTWLTALWPNDVYQRWQKVNAEPPAPKAKSGTKSKG